MTTSHLSKSTTITITVRYIGDIDLINDAKIGYQFDIKLAMSLNS